MAKEFFISTIFNKDPAVLSLHGAHDLSQYEVGVVQLDIPRGIFELEKAQPVSITYKDNAPVVVIVPPGHYEGVEEVFDLISASVRERTKFKYFGSVVVLHGEEDVVQIGRAHV